MRRRGDSAATVAAALVLIVGMGFGRFAFTGLYPLMISDHDLSVRAGSYAASGNYAGYLVGALLSAFLSRVPSRQLCNIAVVSTVGLLGVLALRLPEWAIVAVRGLSGVSSALAMVAASHWLIHDRQYHHGAPALFAGVGIGILVSAEIIAVAHSASFAARTIWLMLALAAGMISVPAILMQRQADRVPLSGLEKPSNSEPARSQPLDATRLIAIYGLAGLGYIITATYLPLLVSQVLTSADPVHIWAVFGLGAVPSCFFWHAMHERFGVRLSLTANLLVQAVGVMLPVLHTPAAYILSALLVGGTFMGTVTIAMPAARKVAESVRFNILAVMTTAYGIGQIVGPLAADMIYSRSQSFDLSLTMAAVALMGGGILAVYQPGAEHQFSDRSIDRP